MTTVDRVGKPGIKPIPDGYHTVSPYLIVEGATSALDFYCRAFGAKEVRRLSMPGGKVTQAQMQIGDSIIVLADEFPSHQAFSPETLGGSPAFVVLHLDEIDTRVEQAVAAGAKILRPIENQFSGDRSATVIDPYGHRWTLTTHIEDVSGEEMERRFAAMMGPGAKVTG